MSLASELISAGAKVTLIYGPGEERPPVGAKVVKVLSSKDMFEAVKHELKKRFDVVIMAAAIADYVPASPKKTKMKSSKNEIKISLKKAPKIIDHIKKYQKDVLLVGFKAETNISKNQLVESAKKKLRESSSDMIVANDIGLPRYKKNPQNNQVTVVDCDKAISSGWMKKEKIGKFIRKQIEEKLK